jgi:Uncharacterized protein conserved in bacteria
MSLPLALLALAIGALFATYLPMVSRASQLMGAPILGNVPFFLIAFLATLAYALAAGHGRMLAKAASLPPALHLSGVMSATMILGSSYLVPRIGIAAFFVLFVAGQVLTGLLYGQLALFGTPQTVLTPGKLAGAALVVAGVWLVTFR